MSSLPSSGRSIPSASRTIRSITTGGSSMPSLRRSTVIKPRCEIFTRGQWPMFLQHRRSNTGSDTSIYGFTMPCTKNCKTATSIGLPRCIRPASLSYRMPNSASPRYGSMPPSFTSVERIWRRLANYSARPSAYLGRRRYSRSTLLSNWLSARLIDAGRYIPITSRPCRTTVGPGQNMQIWNDRWGRPSVLGPCMSWRCRNPNWTCLRCYGRATLILRSRKARETTHESCTSACWTGLAMSRFGYRTLNSRAPRLAAASKKHDRCLIGHISSSRKSV
mmetsp:Transcript_11000/g.30854  ORF Transcript_11000/g.30854 Transcript_11000/m.30854 type:complete len:277 (+) Transcript_11000:980-1810(+)